MLSQGAEGRGAALGPALFGPQAALQRHLCNGVKWGSHCWPPHRRPMAHRPQRMEPGKQRARAAGRGERAPFPQNRPPVGFRAPRSGLRRIRPRPPLRLTVHPQQHCLKKPCLSPRVSLLQTVLC